MNESVVMWRPREQWPTRHTHRWYSGWAPAWIRSALGRVWPEERARTLAELSRDMETALRMPGYQMAIAPPIRTRIDMLTTGVRTPVGIKVFGDDLNEIERVSIALEGMLRQVPGTRSTFAERQTGREYVDIVPNREAIARYGLTGRDVEDVVEAAVGGVMAGTRRFQSTLGPFPAYARRVRFRFHCEHPQRDRRAPCCAGESQEIRLSRTRSPRRRPTAAGSSTQSR